MQTQLQTQIQRTSFSHYILVLRRSSSKRLNKKKQGQWLNPSMIKWHRQSLCVCVNPLVTLTLSLYQESPRRKNEKSEATGKTRTRSFSRNYCSRLTECCSEDSECPPPPSEAKKNLMHWFCQLNVIKRTCSRNGKLRTFTCSCDNFVIGEGRKSVRTHPHRIWNTTMWLG